MSFVGVQSHQQVDSRRYTWSPPEKRGSPGVTPCPRRACCSRATSPSSTRRPATAAPPRARRPASPTASSTTGPAPAWSSPRCVPAGGSGTQRLYGFRDILVLKVVKRLLDTGVSLQQIRGAIQVLRARGVDDLAQITLMSDGASVYECTSSEEVIDLLQGGQGVFGIALGKVWREVEGELAHLPSERAEHEVDATPAAGRRARRPPRRAPGLSPRHRPTGSPVVDWRPPLTPCGRDLDAVSSGRRRGKPPRNLSGAKDHTGQAPLEHPAPAGT